MGETYEEHKARCESMGIEHLEQAVVRLGIDQARAEVVGRLAYDCDLEDDDTPLSDLIDQWRDEGVDVDLERFYTPACGDGCCSAEVTMFLSTKLGDTKVFTKYVFGRG